MRKVEENKFKTYKQMGEFGAKRTERLVAGTYIRERFDEMTALVLAVQIYFSDQLGQTNLGRGKTIGKVGARHALVDELKIVRRTAKMISNKQAGFGEGFTFPKNGSDQSILNAAYSFHKLATPYVDIFVKYRLPADFLTQLEFLTKTFEQALKDSNEATGERMAATAAVDNFMTRAKELAKELDGLVKNEFQGDIETLNAWEIARHMEKVHHSSVKPEPTTPEPTEAEKPTETHKPAETPEPAGSHE